MARLDGYENLGINNEWEEKEIEVEGDKILVWGYTIDISKHGAYINGEMKFNEYMAFENLMPINNIRDVEYRNVRPVLLTQTQKREKEDTNNQMWSNKEVLQELGREMYDVVPSYGIIAKHELVENGLFVTVETLISDDWAMRGVERLKHKQMVGIPIIQNNVLVGLGITEYIHDRVRYNRFSRRAR